MITCEHVGILAPMSVCPRRSTNFVIMNYINFDGATKREHYKLLRTLGDYRVISGEAYMYKLRLY